MFIKHCAHSNIPKGAKTCKAVKNLLADAMILFNSSATITIYYSFGKYKSLITAIYYTYTLYSA